jgi:peptidoglycan/xylan/chitin deacetylase (PgdA/CDA1 family)
MKNQIIITTSWDDGHKLDLKLAKLLTQYNITGTLYISPNNQDFDKPDLLSNSDILQLSKDFEIGAHTMTHPDLTKVSLKEAQMDIRDSKDYLETLTNNKVSVFCYPFGHFNSDIKEIVRQSGFRVARTAKRFETTNEGDTLCLPTTVHAYSHLQDLINWKILLRCGTIDWEVLATKYCDYVLENGGVFHLWGHSWEIDRLNNWQKLERVLQYISNREEVKYSTNSELV